MATTMAPPTATYHHLQQQQQQQTQSESTAIPILRKAAYIKIKDLANHYNIDIQTLPTLFKQQQQATTSSSSSNNEHSKKKKEEAIIKVDPSEIGANARPRGGGKMTEQQQQHQMHGSGSSISGTSINTNTTAASGTTTPVLKSHHSHKSLSCGYNLCLLVGDINMVVDKFRVDQSRVRLAEVEVGDETGTISLRARDDQIDILQKVSSEKNKKDSGKGCAVVLRNCTIELYQQKHLRLAITKWGKLSDYPDNVSSTPNPPLSMNREKNISLADVSGVLLDVAARTAAEMQQQHVSGATTGAGYTGNEVVDDTWSASASHAGSKQQPYHNRRNHHQQQMSYSPHYYPSQHEIQPGFQSAFHHPSQHQHHQTMMQQQQKLKQRSNTNSMRSSRQHHQQHNNQHNNNRRHNQHNNKYENQQRLWQQYHTQQHQMQQMQLFYQQQEQLRQRRIIYEQQQQHNQQLYPQGAAALPSNIMMPGLVRSVSIDSSCSTDHMSTHQFVPADTNAQLFVPLEQQHQQQSSIMTDQQQQPSSSTSPTASYTPTPTDNYQRPYVIQEETCSFSPSHSAATTQWQHDQHYFNIDSAPSTPNVHNNSSSTPEEYPHHHPQLPYYQFSPNPNTAATMYGLRPTVTHHQHQMYSQQPTQQQQFYMSTTNTNSAPSTPAIMTQQRLPQPPSLYNNTSNTSSSNQQVFSNNKDTVNTSNTSEKEDTQKCDSITSTS